MRRVAFLVLLVALGGCASPAAPSVPAPAPCSAAHVQDHGGAGVCVTTRDGWVLQGALWNANATDAPSVMLVHGLNEDHHSYDALAQQLAARGMRVLAFDSRGHGESTHRADNTTRTLAEFAASDFLAMEDDLSAWGASDAVVGASVGANEALRFASAQLGVRTLVLLSAGDDYRGIDATSPAARYPGSILFLASSGDTYAASSARDLAARHAGPDEVDVVAGDAHGTNLLREPGIAGAVVKWVAQATAKPL